MLKKLCSYTGCNELIDYSNKYCDKHKEIVDKDKKEQYRIYKANRQDKDIQKIYVGSRWKKVRQVALARAYGLCEECLKNHEISYADEVHHKQPIKSGGHAYDLDNLICLCHRCHMKAHAELDKLNK